MHLAMVPSVNSPLTLRPSSRLCAKKRRWPIAHLSTSFFPFVWRESPRLPQHVERDENLSDLAPKGRLVAAEAFECPIVEVGEPQETSPDLDIDCLGRPLRVTNIGLPIPSAISTDTATKPDSIENATLGPQRVPGLTQETHPLSTETAMLRTDAAPQVRPLR
jgi:hypothetical protein